MRNEEKNKTEMLEELKTLRWRVKELERSIAKLKLSGEEISKLSSAVEQSIDGIAIGDLEPKLIYVNDAYAKMHGYLPEEMIGLKVANLHSEEQMDEYESGIKQIKKQGSWIGEIGHIRKDGTVFPTHMSVTLLKDNNGKPAGILASCSDITKRKQAEEQLRRSKEEYFAMTNLTGDIIMRIIDKEGKWYLNDGACRFWGKSREELLGFDPADYLHPDDVKKVEAAVQEMHKTKDIVMGLVVREKTPRGWRVVEWNAAPILNETGKYLGFQATGRDITERTKAEETLRESEEKYRKLFEETTDAIFLADAQTGILIDCNLAASKLVGRAKSELVGKHQRILHPPEEIEGEFSRTFKQHITEQKGQVLEAQVITKKGEIRHAAIRASLLELKGKKQAQAIFRDITERKEAEEALRESEERFRELADSLPEAVWEVDLNGKFTYLNERTFEMSGYTREDFDKGLDFCQTLVPEERNKAEEHMRSILDGKVVGGVEYTGLRKDGSRPYVVVHARLNMKDGKPVSVRGIATDITERKRLEEALQQQAYRNEAILQTLVDGFCILGRDGKMLEVNTALCNMTGLSKEELLRTNIYDLDIGKTSEEVGEQADLITKNGYACFETKHHRKDGKILDIEISAQLCDFGQEKFFFVFFRDITKRKQLLTELEQYKSGVLKVQKRAYIDSVGTAVAHQLNQPLTMMNMLLSRSVEQVKSESCCPDVVKNIEESLSEAKRAASIIAKFRQHCKDPSWDMNKTVTVVNIVERIVSMLSEAAKRAQIKICVNAMEKLPQIKTSETALEQIFFVIIQNAIEAADGKKQHNLNITAKSADGKIKLQFSDDCCGIAPENLEKIFEPFFSTKSAGEGAGLGLEIAQRILITLGGEIRVESRLGKGATFYVTLPINSNLHS